jgi:predicted Zn-dependent protease with MMP-like domain
MMQPDDEVAVDLRDRRPGRRPEHGHSDVHDRAVSSRADRLRRYRAAREEIAPRASLRAFEALVAEALDGLPPYVQERLENVAVVVEERAGPERLRGSGDPDADLLGLYEGINRLERASGYHLVAPDRITLFWRPIVEEVGNGDREAIRREIRKTVIHEVAHHFGMDDAELEQLGG